MVTQTKVKRLFFDIETSYNLVSSFNIGEVYVTPENIVRERAIICICYKWQGSSKIHSLYWNKGDDKQLLEEFIKIANEADELVAHNGDSFDIKWIRTRCLYHRIKMFPKYKSVDTLKSARTFKFNSKKLDYLGQLLKVGKKLDTGGLSLWVDVIEKNSKTALAKMIKYCKKDVQLLEAVYNELEPYVYSSIHTGVLLDNEKASCPRCAGTDLKHSKERITAAGTKVIQVQCGSCGKYSQLSMKTWSNYLEAKNDLSKLKPLKK